MRVERNLLITLVEFCFFIHFLCVLLLILSVICAITNWLSTHLFELVSSFVLVCVLLRETIALPLLLQQETLCYLKVKRFKVIKCFFFFFFDYVVVFFVLLSLFSIFTHSGGPPTIEQL